MNSTVPIGIILKLINIFTRNFNTVVVLINICCSNLIGNLSNYNILIGQGSGYSEN